MELSEIIAKLQAIHETHGDSVTVEMHADVAITSEHLGIEELSQLRIASIYMDAKCGTLVLELE